MESVSSPSGSSFSFPTKPAVASSMGSPLPPPPNAALPPSLSLPMEEETPLAITPAATASKPPSRHAHPRTPRTSEEALFDEAQIAAKYRRYEKEFLRRINHKHFSNLSPSGEPVFESSLMIENFLFKESGDPPFKKFIEGPDLVVDEGKHGAPDMVPTSSGRKTQSRKNRD